MASRRKFINRRSFVGSVVGGAAAGSLLVVSGDARAGQTGCTDTDPISRGGDPGGRGRNCANRPVTGCSDSDPSDPGGRGRNCANRPSTGCSDRDPTDPAGRGRNCVSTGCTDSDPTDRSGSGRNCRPSGGAYQTGRHERRYEVCWVDHPNRSDDDCNILTHSEWQTTWSDGRVEYDASESQRNEAQMRARGYTPRWHRMIVNDWVGELGERR
jgi:hypothetical protein